MWRIVLLAALGVVIAACGADRPGVGSELLITNVIVISGHDAELANPTSVLVVDGRIAAVGEDARATATRSAQIIDGDAGYLIPGLIDSHTHLAEIPGMTYEHEQNYPDVARDARAQIPRSYLYHGFTTVIDLNSTPDVIRDWNAADVRPTAYFCGASPVFDGYPMSWMPKPQRYSIMPYFLFDESRADEFPQDFNPEEHSPDSVARRIHDDGGICVKTHYERGFGGRGDLPVPTTELIQALVAAAHRSGLKVLIHANSESSQSFGNTTGADAFAHGMWTWNDRSQTDLNANIAAIVDESIDQGIALQPTVQVLYGEQDIFNPDYLDDPRVANVVPQSLIDWYRTEDGQWWRQRLLSVPIVAQLVEEGLWHELDAPPIARVTATLRHFAANDGHLLFGSDTPSDPTFANPPGLNGRFEMNNWLAAGISPAQIFEAATIDNAVFFGLDDELGSIEIGKRADLLLLRANPLEAVEAYDAIDYVILGGNPIARDALSAQ